MRKLQIEKGLVKSLVVGSGRKPYEITIRIDLLNKEAEKEITDLAGNKIESLEPELPCDLTKILCCFLNCAELTSMYF